VVDWELGSESAYCLEMPIAKSIASPGSQTLIKPISSFYPASAIIGSASRLIGASAHFARRLIRRSWTGGVPCHEATMFKPLKLTNPQYEILLLQRRTAGPDRREIDRSGCYGAHVRRWLLWQDVTLS